MAYGVLSTGLRDSGSAIKTEVAVRQYHSIHEFVYAVICNSKVIDQTGAIPDKMVSHKHMLGRARATARKTSRSTPILVADHAIHSQFFLPITKAAVVTMLLAEPLSHHNPFISACKIA